MAEMDMAGRVARFRAQAASNGLELPASDDSIIPYACSDEDLDLALMRFSQELGAGRVAALDACSTWPPAAHAIDPEDGHLDALLTAGVQHQTAEDDEDTALAMQLSLDAWREEEQAKREREQVEAAIGQSFLTGDRERLERLRSDVDCGRRRSEAAPTVVVVEGGRQNIDRDIFYTFVMLLDLRHKTGREPCELEFESDDAHELEVSPRSMILAVGGSAAPLSVALTVRATSQRSHGETMLRVKSPQLNDAGPLQTVIVSYRLSQQAQMLEDLARARPPAPAWEPSASWCSFLGVPCGLIKWDTATGVPCLVPSTLNMLANLPDIPIHVVCIVGQYRRGKSCLLNQLAGRVGAGFEVGHTVKGKTEGFDCILMRHWTKDESELVLLLDTEGTDDAAKDDVRTTYIFVLAWLLCSCFVYNTLGVPERQSSGSLQAAGFLAQRLEDSLASDDEAGSEMIDREKCHPALTWVVRDWCLELPEGKDFNQYLEEDVLQTIGVSTSAKAARRNGELLRKLFPRRQMAGIVRPVVDEGDLQRLETPDVQSRVRPEFREQIIQVCSLIEDQSRPRMEPSSGTLLRGGLIAEYFAQVVETVKSGDLLTIENAWSRVERAVNEKNLAAAKHSFSMRMDEEVDKLQAVGLQNCNNRTVRGWHHKRARSAMPLEEEDIFKAREVAHEHARQQLHQQAVCGSGASQEESLMEHVLQCTERLRHTNQEHSEAFCRALSEEVCQDLQEAIAAQQMERRRDCSHLLELLDQAAQDYEVTAVGPAKYCVGRAKLVQMQQEVLLVLQAQDQINKLTEAASANEAEYHAQLEEAKALQRNEEETRRRIEAQMRVAESELERLRTEAARRQRDAEREMQKLRELKRTADEQNLKAREKLVAQNRREQARREHEMQRLQDAMKNSQQQVRRCQQQVQQLQSRPPQRVLVRERGGCSVQ